MAILENIRKRTTVLILIIGMALFAFVISGIFTSNDLGGAKIGSAVGEINGEAISIDEFRQRVERISRRSGPTSTSTQLVNSVWNQLERNTILDQQMEDLGLSIEQDQIMEVIKSSPGISQNPQFLDENGIFDEGLFRDFIAELRLSAPAQYEDWLQDEQSIIEAAKQQSYFNLIRAGMGATLKEGELNYKLANDKVDIRYVRVPYSNIPDSAVVVTKEEIASYIEEHEADYKQEKARDIRFVYFEEKPSEADEEAVKQAIADLLKDRDEYIEERDTTETISGFRTTQDLAAFLDRNSDTKFDTIFKAKKDLPQLFADSLLALQVGEIFGPYKDGNTYKVSRMVARKPNGSAKASHILIAYEGALRANPEVTRTKEEAEQKAQELLVEARKTGTVFSQLARDNSDGPSAPMGGDLGYFVEGVMTPKFNDFVFNNAVDNIGLVETDFGYHIVRVDDKQDIVQIADLTRTLEPSEETINTLFTEATKFEMAATSEEKPFEEAAREAQLVIRPVNKIKAMDENLPGLASQRSIVQWAFNEETEVGDIRRFNINSGYAVVQLTAKYNEGIMAVEDASATALPKIRKERKAAMIIAENSGKSLEELATANSTIISTASALTASSPTIAGAGREPMVVGTAFALDEGQVSGLIEGESGVFLLEVSKKEAAPALDNYSTYAGNLQSANAARVNNAVFTALKNKAEIEDNRSVFY